MVIRSRLISAGQKKEKTANDFQIVHYSDKTGFEWHKQRYLHTLKNENIIEWHFYIKTTYGWWNHRGLILFRVPNTIGTIIIS